jgi:hypothetical protein
MKSMNRSVVMHALRQLGKRAQDEGLLLECCIYGGALMMLAYDARTSTKDVDAVVRPRDPALRLAKVVGEELGLPHDWLNDQVRTFLAPSEQLGKLPIDIPGLHVTAPTAGYLLAMKALACRSMLPGYSGDQEDLHFLIRKMNIHSVEEIQNQIAPYCPDDVIPAAHKATLQLLIQEVWS